jgi:hypothetical protein
MNTAQDSSQFSVVGDQSVNTRDQLPVTSNQTTDTGDQESVTSDQQVGFGDQQSVIDNQTSDIGNQQLASSNQLPVIGDQISDTGDQITETTDQQSAISNQPSVISDQQTAHNDLTGIQQAVGQVVVSAPVEGADREPEVGYGGDKERAEVMGASENVPLVEIREEAEIEPEVEGWLEKLEQAGEVHLPQPVTHDDRVIVADAGAQITKDRVVLPVTLSDQKVNLKKKPEESARWLAVWIERITKMFEGKFRYREEVVVAPASSQTQRPQQEIKATGV